MNPEELRSDLPSAQQEVLEHRAFKAEVIEVNRKASELEERLSSLNSFFEQTLAELGQSHTFKLRLAVIQEEVDSNETTKPGGNIEVDIREIKQHEIHINKYRSDEAYYDVVGHELVFRFTPFHPGSNLANDRESVVTARETTIAEQLESTSFYSRGKNGAIIAKFNDDFDNGKDLLRTYSDQYLPGRSRQIEGLEQSAQMIKTAMEDFKLNSFIKFERERLAEEKRLKEQQEAESEYQITPESVAATAIVHQGRERRRFRTRH